MDGQLAYDDEPEAEAVDPRAALEGIIAAENLAGMVEDGKANEIVQAALRDYEIDKDSMSDWREKMERGIELASLVKEDKNYPYPGASNVKYPLITSAALQFNARAYPAIVPAEGAVKARVWGKDPEGKKAARASRVSEHMSWQLAAKVPEWEETTDKLLVQLPIVGEMFRKWWFDPVDKRPRCRLIEAGKFIINDKVTCLDEAPRGTEEITLYPHEIAERVNSGTFIEFEYTEDSEEDAAPQEFIEQHCRLDMDDDGYAEPYILTIHIDTQTLVRMVADFDVEDVIYKTEQQPVTVMRQMENPQTGAVINYPMQEVQEVETGVMAIRRNAYFIHFQFLPGIDGGFHGTGLGLLLGDISDTINTIINQLMDAGHYASLGGGFIGSEFRLKGGSHRPRPGEYMQVNAKGGDVRSAIVEKTFPGPDATLYAMLGMLIDAGREIASVKDVVTGEQPRQQQTATTTLALIEQGMMVFTAAYKRIFRACKKEYNLLAAMNAQTISPEEYQAFHDEPADPRADYDMSDMDIQPVADPRSVTKMQQAAKAQLVMQLAEMGMVDRAQALGRIGEAMDIEDTDELQPQPNPVQQQMEMLGMQAAQADVSLKMVDIELKMAQIEETRAQAVKALSSAQSDQEKTDIEKRKQRLDGLFRFLEEDRARLEAVLRGPGGMAHKSGNGSDQGGAGSGPGPAERRAVDGLLSGTATAGLGAGGAETDGGLGGGFV